MIRHINKYGDPTITHWELDDKGNKISVKVLNEKHTVVGGKITLLGLPDEMYRVYIGDMVEIDINEDIKNKNEFKVDYRQTGVAYFSQELEGQEVTVNRYYSRGVVYFPSNRIWTKVDEWGNVSETLDAVADKIETAIIVSETIGDTIVKGEETNTKIQNSITKAEKTDKTLNTTTSNAEKKDLELKATTEKAELTDKNLTATEKKATETDVKLKATDKTANETDVKLKGTIATANKDNATLKATTDTAKATDKTLNTTITNAKAIDEKVLATTELAKKTDTEVKGTIATAKATDTTLNATEKKATATDTKLKATNKTANETDAKLKATTDKADNSNLDLIGTTETAVAKNTELKNTTVNATKVDTELKSNTEKAKVVDKSIVDNTTKGKALDSQLVTTIKSGNDTKAKLDTSISTGNATDKKLAEDIAKAVVENEKLTNTIVDGKSIDAKLEKTIENAILNDDKLLATIKDGTATNKTLGETITKAVSQDKTLNISVDTAKALEDKLNQIISGTEFEEVIKDIADLKKDISNKWDKEDLKIGGRNYIKDSRNFDRKVWALFDNASVTSEKMDNGAYHIKTQGGNQKIKMFYMITKEKNMLLGNEVTLSFKIKANNPIEINHNWAKASGMYNIPAGFDGVYTITSEPLKSSAGQIQFRTENVEDELDFEIEWIKFENGTIATDWTPATEDIENELDRKWDKEDLKVGGRNFLINSGVEIKDIADYKVATYKLTEPLKEDEDYTFSVEMAVNMDTWDREGKFRIYNSGDLNANVLSITDFEPKDHLDYHKITRTFKGKEVAPNNSILIYVGSYQSVNKSPISFRNAKLEKGNIATDWTPAIEDFDDRANKWSRDVLKIGGRNYYVDSHKHRLLPNASDDNNVSAKLDRDGMMVNTVTALKDGVAISCFSQFIEIPEELQGMDNVVSLDVFPSEDMELNCVGKTYTYAKANEWTRIWSIRNSDDTQTRFGLYSKNPVNKGTTVKAKGFKLEKGNIATDWTPAIEDMEIGLDKKLSRPMKMGKNILNIADVYNVSGVGENGIKIKTNIDEKSIKMTTLQIKGYNYFGNTPIGLDIAFYTYSKGLYNLGVSSTNNYKPLIKIGVEDGKVVFWIDEKRASASLNLSAITHLGGELEDFEGWKIIGETLDENATDVKILPYRNEEIPTKITELEDDTSKDNKIQYSNYADRIRVEDTREIDDTPRDIMKSGASSLRFDFKKRSKVGSPDYDISAHNDYAHILTVYGWRHSSGGYPTQISFGQEKVGIRTGISDTEWSEWRKHSDDSVIFKEIMGLDSRLEKVEEKQTPRFVYSEEYIPVEKRTKGTIYTFAKKPSVGMVNMDNVKIGENMGFRLEED